MTNPKLSKISKALDELVEKAQNYGLSRSANQIYKSKFELQAAREKVMKLVRKLVEIKP